MAANEFYYALNTKDRNSDRVGCFVHSSAKLYAAISPIFYGPECLYKWIKEHNFVLQELVPNGHGRYDRVPFRLEKIKTKVDYTLNNNVDTLSKKVLSLSREPNEVGELLRDSFFIQDSSGGLLGGWNCFDWKAEVRKIYTVYRDDLKLTMNVVGLDDVELHWCFTDDTTLIFLFPNGDALVNFHAEKETSWFWEKAAKIQIKELKV